jgi:hypothetical protein
LAEDVNGNGRLDFNDIVVLFENLAIDLVQQSVFAYDFNQNGRVDMSDVTALFDMVVP